MKTNGEKLRNLRTAYGLSQEQFGNALSITKSSINAYEHDRNPINYNVKYKILQATGIGFDYFDTDMELWEAFTKYGLDPNHLKLKSFTECIVYVYPSISDFAARERAIQEKRGEVDFLEFITKYKNSKYCLVRVRSGEGGFIAQEGDILVLIDDDAPMTEEWIIAKYRNNTFIVQYFFVSDDEIELRSSMYNFKFSEKRFEDEVEIAGVIKSKIPNPIKIKETIPDYLRK
nr:helix-turn-helix transcriptional regulator [uncultured Campylobacter sp.]